MDFLRNFVASVVKCTWYFCVRAASDLILASSPLLRQNYIISLFIIVFTFSLNVLYTLKILSTWGKYIIYIIICIYFYVLTLVFKGTQWHNFILVCLKYGIYH